MPRSRQSTAVVVAGRPTREHVLSARPSVPDHVVYREFVNETVVLNLETGTYHGLNPSGGKMLETLGAAATVREAAVSLAEYFGRPLTRNRERSLRVLCPTARARPGRAHA